MFKKVIVGLMLVTSSALAIADTCDGALVDSTQGYLPEDAKTLASYKLIDAESYNRIKPESAKNLSTGTSFNIFKSDVDFSADYAEFNEKRNKRLSKYQYKDKDSEARDNLRLFLTSQQITPWLNCKLNAGGLGSVVMEITDIAAGPKTASVVFHTLTSNQKAEVEVELEGATIRKKNKLTVPILGKNSDTFTIKLDANASTAKITAHLASSVDTLQIVLKEKTYKAPVAEKKAAFTPPENTIPFRFYVCSGKETGCVSLPTKASDANRIKVPGLSASQYISAVSQDFNLGTLTSGTPKNFTLITATAEKAATDCTQAHEFKLTGYPDEISDWRQEVIVYVTTAKLAKPCAVPK